MSTEPDDASWQMVERIARDWLGASARLVELSFLSGGIVNTTLMLRTQDGTRAVLKVSAHRATDAHEREARSLGRLAALGVPVPEVHASRIGDLDAPHSYILMSVAPGMTMRDAKRHCAEDAWEQLQHELADYVAAIHTQPGPHYGRIERGGFADWPAFYRSLVEPIWHEAERLNCLPIKTRKTIARIHERLEKLVGHTDGPRLCHGDLWGANILVEANGDGRWHITAIIDPDLRHGHAEAEIAYMDLFKTITPTFKQAYQTHFKLGDGYHTLRKPIYQLYGLMNQLQLHGASATHTGPVIAAAERLATMV